MNTALLCELAFLGGLIAYLHGHQASHLAWLSTGSVRLNPSLTRALLWSFQYPYQLFAYVPWLLLFWYGYKTVWWYALVALVAGFVVRLALVWVEINTGLTKRAWLVSLSGIPIVPVALLIMTGLVRSAH